MVRSRIYTTLITILLGITSSVFYAQTVSGDHLDGVIFVKLDQNSGVELTPYDSSLIGLNALILNYQITDILKPFDGLNNDTLDHTYKFHFDSISSVGQLIQDLELLSYVDYAERAPLFRTVFTPDDLHENQWYLEKINAEVAWDITKGDASVTIAVIDNAVLFDHEDLQANSWENPGETENGTDSDLNGYTDDIHGYDVADGNNDPRPPQGASAAFSHGTHCAGIASAVTNNGTGMAGLGYSSQIISVKCTLDSSSGDVLTHAYEGLRYAVDVNADIVSMSWGSRASSFTGDALLNTANLQGITMFAAAGNKDENNTFSPASHQNVMAVGSTNQDDEKSGFSNYGSDIAFMAPGSSIWSTTAGSNSEYGYSSGTSMACPLAAGLGALILSNHSNYSPGEIQTAIEEGCDNIDEQNPDYAGQLGAGRINAGKTLDPATFIQNSTESTNEISLFPNPVHQTLNVKIPAEEAGQVHITAFNSAGVAVMNRQISANQSGYYKVNGFQDLPHGIYLLQLKTPGNVFHDKVMVTGGR